MDTPAAVPDTRAMNSAPPVAARRLRAILLPPTSTRRQRQDYRPGMGPDPGDLARLLAENGIDLVVTDPAGRPANPLAGRGSVLESLDPLRALRILVFERKADIVISVFEGGALALLLLRRLAAFRVPCVLWDIGLTDTWRLREWILDRVVPRVAGIFVLGASQQAYIAQRWRWSRGVEVVGHRVDTTFFVPAAAVNDGSVLLVGDDAGRDFATFLRAIGGLQAPFVIRSGRLRDHGPMPANVTVQPDKISALALRGLYQSCRFVVVPLHATLNASGVSTILEAGATGRALVVSDNPAIRDFVVPDVTCLLVPCDDPAALRQAIERLLREPHTCARLGANARRFVEQRCSPPVFATRLAALIRHYACGNDATSVEQPHRHLGHADPL